MKQMLWVSQRYSKRFLVVFLFTLLIPACASVLAPANPAPVAPTPDLPPAQSISDESTIEKAEIFFWVEIPNNTPPGQIIQIAFLNEVSGLALNSTVVNLHAVDATHYGIALHIKLGAALKYRFIREDLEGNRAEEYTLNGAPVRYRMYMVDGPGETHALVARWSDTEPERLTGRISGVAVDAQTNLPIPNLLVFAGGEQVLTNSSGRFLFPALITGQHQITAYSMNGQYQAFKQNAVVSADAETPTTLTLQPSPVVEVTFKVTVPADTIPSVPVRIAGNLSQLGNTFTNLGGDTSLMPSKMPQLQPLADGSYGATVKLYGGTFLRYTYTQGDGYWNTEQNETGTLSSHNIYLPLDQSRILFQDTVTSWQAPQTAPILFDVIVPGHTPTRDTIYIQFQRNAVWMAPLPMWPVSQNRWAYQLSAPLPSQNQLTYRYCRNAICGGDSPLASQNEPYQIDTGQAKLQIVRDIVSEWHLFAPRQFPTTVLGNLIHPRTDAFRGGVMFAPKYSPIWDAHTTDTFLNVQELNANTVVLTPSWVATQVNPPYFTSVLGQSQGWDDLAESILTAQATGMHAVLFPQMQLPTAPEAWWAEMPNTAAGWQVWWEQYRAFVLHHADIAQRYNADTLVLGGEWLAPALPGAHEDLPIDIETRWRKLLGDVRLHYGGTLAWYLPFEETLTPPPFLDTVDTIYLNWGATLATWPEATLPDLQARIGILLEEYVKPLKDSTGKNIILIANYPSAQGGMTHCIQLPDTEACIPFADLSPTAADNPLVLLDLQEQVEVYNALLARVNETDWIDGFISADYFAPVGLEDKSSSIHGKPAEDVLRFWFKQMLDQ